MLQSGEGLARRKVLAVIVAVALSAGYLIATGGGSSTVQSAPPPRDLSPSDLLLAAGSAQGITMTYAGIGSDIPMQSFQFGTGRPIQTPAGGVREAGKPMVSEITMTKTTDKSSMKLLQSSLSGNPAAVTLVFTNMSGPGNTLLDYMRVDLTDVLISGFNMSSGGDQPTESISLNFAKMKFTTHIPAGTTQVATWDLVNGTTS
jgi:type VI secretion system secreted protein Hcp